MDDDELELVETTALMAELYKRFDALIFMGVVDRDSVQNAGGHFWKGHFYQCIGMTEDLKGLILKQMNASREEASGL